MMLRVFDCRWGNRTESDGQDRYFSVCGLAALVLA